MREESRRVLELIRDAEDYSQAVLLARVMGLCVHEGINIADVGEYGGNHYGARLYRAELRYYSGYRGETIYHHCYYGQIRGILEKS